MPLYDFECNKHGIFEEYHPMDESTIQKTSCPICGIESNRIFIMPFIGKKSNNTSIIGKTRTEHNKILHNEGWGSCFADESQVDKCKYLEKKGIGYPTGAQINKVK